MAIGARIPATLIPGDGIGPEIMDAVLAVLDAVDAPFDWDRQAGGLAGIEASGDPLPKATLDSIRRTRAADNARKCPHARRVWSLRQRSPGRTMIPGGRYEDIDIVLIRENIEGLYVAFEHFIAVGDDPRAVAISQRVNTAPSACELCAMRLSLRPDMVARKSR